MSVALKVMNLTVALNTNLDDAKKRAGVLANYANDPVNRVNPASIAKVEDVQALLSDADATLAEFAQMNAIQLP